MLQDRRNKLFILFVAELVSLAVVGVAMAYALPAHNFSYGIDFLKRTGAICFALAGVQIVIYMVYSFFYHKASFPFHAGPVGECGPEQSGPYYKIIVLHKVFQRLSSKSGPEISLSDCVVYLSACRTFFSCVRSV